MESWFVLHPKLVLVAAADTILKQVVDRLSACMGLPNEKLFPVDADHWTVCKIPSTESQAYNTVGAWIVKLTRLAIEDAPGNPFGSSSPPKPERSSTDLRRHALAVPAEEDVCFPIEGMSELVEEDYERVSPPDSCRSGSRSRRRRQWPDLSVLGEWSREGGVYSKGDSSEEDQQTSSCRWKAATTEARLASRRRGRSL